MSQSPLQRRRSRRFQYAISRTNSSSLMDVPRLSLDVLSLARALAQAAADSLAQLRTRPRVETAVKGSGGVVATLLALKFAKSLRSACVVGMVAGVFAHSLYADVLRKKPMELTTMPRADATGRQASLKPTHVTEDSEEKEEEDDQAEQADSTKRPEAV